MEPPDLLSIGEYGRLVGLPVSAVRFYADRGILPPCWIDPASGYRFFRPERIADGRLVCELRDIGVPLLDLRRALDAPERISEILGTHADRLAARVAEARRLARSADVAPSATREVGVDAQRLIAAIEQVAHAVATSPALPHLMTVQIEQAGGSVRLVATDTHRLAVSDVAAAASANDFRAVVAAAVIRDWTELLAELGQVTLRATGDVLNVSDGSTEHVASILPIRFPDYESVLTRAVGANGILVNRRELIDAVDGVSADDRGVELLPRSGRVEVRGQMRTAVIDARHDHPSCAVRLDPRYVVDAARSAPADELVIEVEATPTAPVTFRSATSGTYVCLVMPILDDAAR